MSTDADRLPGSLVVGLRPTQVWQQAAANESLGLPGTGLIFRRLLPDPRREAPPANDGLIRVFCGLILRFAGLRSRRAAGAQLLPLIRIVDPGGQQLDGLAIRDDGADRRHLRDRTAGLHAADEGA